MPVVGIYDLISWYQTRDGIKGIGFNKGGTLDLNGAKVTLVNACHSSSVGSDNGPVYAGSEAGFMIAGEGHTIYVSGDTDIMEDSVMRALVRFCSQCCRICRAFWCRSRSSMEPPCRISSNRSISKRGLSALRSPSHCICFSDAWAARR